MMGMFANIQTTVNYSGVPLSLFLVVASFVIANFSLILV